MKPVRRMGLALSLMGAVSAQAVTEEQSPLHLGASLDFSSSLHTLDDPAASRSGSLSLSPSYAIDSQWVLSTTWVFDQELTGEQLFDVPVSSLGVTWAGVALNPYLNLSASGRIGLPISKNKRLRQSLYVSLATGPTLSLDLSATQVAVLEKISASYTFTLGKDFHQYTTSTTGASNTEILLGNLFALRTQLLPTLTLSADFQRNFYRTYAGNFLHRFALGEQVTWAPFKQWSFTLGHTNQGDVIGSNGVDSNIALFNQDDSSVYASVGFVY